MNFALTVIVAFMAGVGAGMFYLNTCIRRAHARHGYHPQHRR
jgi:hypothetical protein